MGWILVAQRPASRRRAVSGLFLTFVLSFVNLVGIIFTLIALGGLEPWSRWQFIGAFGVLEAASGLANVISPNIWRLPVAELQTSERTQIELAGSTMLIPHWAALARFAAGLVLIAIAASREGLALASLALVPLILALAGLVLAVSAVFARVAVIRPEFDVFQANVQWGGRLREFPPVSLSAVVLQLLLSIVTVPAAKLLDPTALYQPELAPSLGALLAVLVASAIAGLLVYLLWSSRVAGRAPAEQQREAEEHA
jgi:hypothetical protein